MSDEQPAHESARAERLVWIDLEMTGLDPEQDRIIEIATLVTDGQLNLIAEGPVLAVHQSDELLNGMDEWNTRTHGASGLTERVRQSPISETEAQAQTLAFVAEHVDERRAPLCGNSVWQDRRFLARYMPTLEAYLHYRLIDVSTVKELARRWRPDLLSGFKKQGAHTALADIRESVAELAYYRSCFIRLD
ncbi:MAG: oligoribonuclease [Pseudomonadota bacterium]